MRPAYLFWTTTPAVVTEGQFRKILDKVKLDDDSFNPTEFVPGSSGASKLYRKLMEDSGLVG